MRRCGPAACGPVPRVAPRFDVDLARLVDSASLAVSLLEANAAA
jgi:hypothetical protein